MATAQELVASIREATQEIVNRDEVDSLDEGWVRILTDVDENLWDVIEDIDSERRTR